MKKYRINILGRNCTIATDRDEVFMRKIESEINEKLQLLRSSMPHADYLDLCIVYLFLLSEKIDILQNTIEKMKKSSEQAKKILSSVQQEIIKQLTNSDGHNRI